MWSKYAFAAAIASRHFNAKTAAVISDISQDYSLELAASFRKEFNEAGGKIVAEIKCKTGDRDFTGQMNRIKTAKPEVMYVPIYYMECALIARQAREMGIDVPIIAADEVQVPEFVELGGKAVEDLVFTTTYFREAMLETDLGKRFSSLCKNDTGKEPRADGTMGAQSYLVILDAVRRAGSSDPENIREALSAASNEEGLTSSMCVQMRVNNRRYPVVNQVREGRFVGFSGPSSWEVVRRVGSRWSGSDRSSP